MAVNLSPIWGAGAQLFDNSGNVLSGGKIYTYAAGTTTPVTTYTSFNAGTANSNPIILNSAGRVPYEIWLTDGVSYKFVLKDSNDTLIATYDNLVGINSNFVAYTAQQEIQTATAGQTVFNLTTMQYQPGTNNLSVFVDGVNQYGPGAQYAYVETDSDTVTFVSGLHVGASVKFTTASPVSSSSTNAANVAYDPPFFGSVTTNVEAKLAQTVSVKDFGAVGDGVTDDATAFTDAGSIASRVQITIPAGIYKLDSNPAPTGYVTWVIQEGVSFTGTGKLPISESKGSILAAADSYKSIESDPAFYNGIFQYLEHHATLTGYGTTGLHGSVQTSNSNGTGARIGVAAFAVNDYTGGTVGATGLYSTVVRESVATGPTLGMEIDVANMGTTVSIFPSQPFKSGTTLGIWCCAGGEITEATPPGSPGVASVAIGIIQNDSQAIKTAKFDKGILFHSDAIDGTDGATGIGIAIAFATGHAMQWYNNATNICAEIVAEGTTQALTNTRLNFSDFGLLYQYRPTGKTLFQVENSSTAVNTLAIKPSDTGVSPRIYARGDDTNIDLTLGVKGSGDINFQDVSTAGGAGASAGYLIVKINGTQRKIPLYQV